MKNKAIGTWVVFCIAGILFQAQGAASPTGGTLLGTLTVTAPPRKAAPVPQTDDDDDGLYQNSAPPPKASTALPEEVVIYLKKVPGHFAPPDKPVALDQKFLQFSRRVLPLLKGTTVAFTNHDPVYHSVFTNSLINHFHLGRKSTGEKSYVTLTHSEIPIRVYCEIHSSMRAFILVLDNPFFTTVGPGQNFEIDGIPPGTYTMVAWHDFWQPVERKVTIKKGAATRADITLSMVQK